MKLHIPIWNCRKDFFNKEFEGIERKVLKEKFKACDVQMCRIIAGTRAIPERWIQYFTKEELKRFKVAYTEDFKSCLRNY